MEGRHHFYSPALHTAQTCGQTQLQRSQSSCSGRVAMCPATAQELYNIMRGRTGIGTQLPACLSMSCSFHTCPLPKGDLANISYSQSFQLKTHDTWMKSSQSRLDGDPYYLPNCLYPPTPKISGEKRDKITIIKKKTYMR